MTRSDPDEFREATVLADGGGDLQAARKRVHAGDVRVEQVQRLEALTANLRIEVHTAGLESPYPAHSTSCRSR